MTLQKLKDVFLAVEMGVISGIEKVLIDDVSQKVRLIRNLVKEQILKPLNIFKAGFLIENSELVEQRFVKTFNVNTFNEFLVNLDSLYNLTANAFCQIHYISQ
jgi:hypothetical protein